MASMAGIGGAGRRPPGEEDGPGPHLLFSLEVGGHHGSYLGHLVRFARERPRSVRLLVSPRFGDVHDGVVETAREAGIPVDLADPKEQREFERLGAGGGRLGIARRALQEWRILSRGAAACGASRVTVLYFDRLLYGPLAWGMVVPVPLSGIFFRPSFHYAGFAGPRPGWADRIRAWRQRITLRRSLRNPCLRTVHSLDPFAVDELRRLSGGTVRIVPLADPIPSDRPRPEEVERLREGLSIPRNRRVLLLFGQLTARKGIREVLDSVVLLPQDVAKETVLLLVGEMSGPIRAGVANTVAVAGRTSPIRIVTVDRHVPESDVDAYFGMADVVLAPYQRHVGMSGVLVRAASAARPVVASGYGLVGEVTRRRGLGLTVDSASPDSLAKAILAALRGGAESGFDAGRAAAFVRENSWTSFAASILGGETEVAPR